MATLRELKTINIPVLMTKDKNEFLLSCKSLSIYIQAKTEEKAKQDFESSLDLLFGMLIKKKTIITYLYQRDLVESDVLTIASADKMDEMKKLDGKIQEYHKKFKEKLHELTLGNHSELEVALA